MYLFPVRGVGVVPAQHALQHEEQHDAREHVDAVPERSLSLHDLRQDVDEHVAQQGAGREADEVEEDALETLVPNAEREDTDQRNETDDDNARERVEPSFGHLLERRLDRGLKGRVGICTNDKLLADYDSRRGVDAKLHPLGAVRVHRRDICAAVGTLVGLDRGPVCAGYRLGSSLKPGERIRLGELVLRLLVFVDRFSPGEVLVRVELRDGATVGTDHRRGRAEEGVVHEYDPYLTGVYVVLDDLR